MESGTDLSSRGLESLIVGRRLGKLAIRCTQVVDLLLLWRTPDSTFPRGKARIKKGSGSERGGVGVVDVKRKFAIFLLPVIYISSNYTHAHDHDNNNNDDNNRYNFFLRVYIHRKFGVFIKFCFFSPFENSLSKTVPNFFFFPSLQFYFISKIRKIISYPSPTFDRLYRAEPGGPDLKL